jgi:murein DD-endopeptidase MepM/ murein hydrolase activator NlpD
MWAGFLPVLSQAIRLYGHALAVSGRTAIAQARHGIRARIEAQERLRPARTASAPQGTATPMRLEARARAIGARWSDLVGRYRAAARATVVSTIQLYKTRPYQLAQYALAINAGLAAVLVIVIAAALMQRSAPMAVEAQMPPQAVHVNAGGPALQIIAAALATPLPPSVPTATPILNFEPWVPTPTPTPIVYPVWEAVLPWEGGWTGEASCSGWYAAPVGGGYFIWPANNHWLSGKNYSVRWHPGLDIAASWNDPIYAADAGVVVYAGWNTWGYGNMVVVDHGDGWHTLYGHFNEVSVYCGQPVTQGTVLGLAGSTGNSTGPHLHFEMRSDVYGRVNPWNYLP